MRTREVFTTWAVLVAAIGLARYGVNSACNGSSRSTRGCTSNLVAGVTSVDFTSITVPAGSIEEGNSASNSGSSSSSVLFPAATTATPATQSAEPPTATTPPLTSVPSTTASSITAPTPTEPVVDIESESASRSQSDESSASTSDTMQSNSVTSAPTTVANSESSSSGSSLTTSSSSEASASAEASNSDAEDDDKGEASIAQPGSDSSTFQSVVSAECSEDEVDKVYTLYSNCRSAFDLCVSASDYQIFPYQGEHPTQAQIQGMAESDACIAMFIIVIGANFSACTIGGMPLVSAVETLLKISVDLEEGLEDEAPSTDVFQRLLAWRYEVDLAKAAGVPYDGSSELYVKFQANLDAAFDSTAIRVNEDLTVDVRLSNGSYETFEDAIDVVVTDASAADLVPGYVVASRETGSSSSSSGSSRSIKNTTGIVIESSTAVTCCTPTLWSLVVRVAVVASAFVLV